jgi:trans-aconitate 2-methyltransferase
MSWDPTRYLQYEDARLRPALDLLARIPLASPRQVVDLGCGAGNVAQWLARRWPESRVLGVDGDAAMLAKARAATAQSAQLRWMQADIGAWRPEAPPDLVYSNAALHWLDDHAMLFPRLLGEVAPGGALAVQMPDNFHAPSHALLSETARSARWHDRLAAISRLIPVASPAQYHAWLAPQATTQDLWRTEYLQLLAARDDGEHPVVAWQRGSALIPFLAVLQEDARAAFVADYAAQIEGAYPRRANGSVMFPFRRMFIVATH